MKNENKKMEIEKGCCTQLTVKVVIVDKDQKILLLKRAAEGVKNNGKYDLPGGWLEEDESVLETLKREIKEETDLENVEIGEVLRLDEFEKDGKVSNLRGLRYIGFYNGGEIKLNPREHQSFEWLSFEEALSKLKVDDGFEAEKRETILTAQKYLAAQNSLEGWKRCLAEFENYKKMQAESQKDRIRYATENVILQILPVIDNFHASTDHIPEEQKDNSWVTGIMYIQKQLENVLAENGAEEINLKVGDNFDAKYCEAVLENSDDKKGKKNTDKAGDKKSDKIKKVILKGYKIGEKVIRPMRVTVV